MFSENCIYPRSTVGHQQQAIQEDIAGISFPENMEQEPAQYGNESHIEVQGEIQGICVAVLRSRGGVLPFAMNCAYAEHQCSQIQHILPGIAPFDVGRTEGSVIDFLEESTPSAVSGKGRLAAGVGAVCPLGQMLASIEVHSISRMFPEVCQALQNCLPADLICQSDSCKACDLCPGRGNVFD